MSDAIDALIDRVIEREGGFVNNPSDRGGATNWGITQGTLSGWRGYQVSVDQVRQLSKDEARSIYRERYFDGLEDVTDPKVLEFLFDYAVNSGTNRAVRALQKVIGTTVDGAFGPLSRAALARFNQADLYWPLVCERLDNYLRIIGYDYYHGEGKQAQFAEGWANRIVPFWDKADA